MQKKNFFTPLTLYVHSARPEQRSAMKTKQSIQYNQSDGSYNIFTKFDQNPTHSNQDISRESGTDRHTDKVCRSHSPQTVTIMLAFTIKTQARNNCFVLVTKGSTSLGQ